jgi:hypothetical protein
MTTPGRSSRRPFPLGLRTLVLALALAAAACREQRPATVPAAAPSGSASQNAPAEERLFTLADLALATRFDARFQQVVALASDYKTALTFDRGERLTEHSDLVARRLDQAIPDAERAATTVKDPRDRALVQPLVAAARRWPGLLRAARTELLSAPPSGPTQAALALEATDDEIARSLEAYRAFRGTWRITDSPVEPEPVLEFLRARRDLESKEVEIGRALPGAPGAAAPSEPARIKADVEAAVGKARAAASRIEGGRRESAGRWVDAEEQALAALAGMASPKAIDEQRGRDALAYQIAKARALEAVADYVELTARLPTAPR